MRQLPPLLAAAFAADGEMGTLNRLALRLPADPTRLSVLRKLLEDFLVAHRVGEHDLFDLTVAISEAAANAIEHPVDPTEPVIGVAVTIEDCTVTATVRDSGRWRESTGSSFRGRGLALIRALGGLTVTRTDHGTEVTLCRRLAASPVGCFTIDDNDYDELYRDTADTGGPPWDIGGPQPALAAVLDDGVPGPKVLDIGCGTGDLALALARRGYQVTAVDISRVAVGMARAKAAREGLTVHFEVQDATELSSPSAPFDSVFDSGLLHSLHRRGGGEVDDYLALLPGLAAPGATVFVLAVSPDAGHGWGVTEEFLRAGFPEPEWVDTAIEEIDVAAAWGGQEFCLPGFLLRTVRAVDSSTGTVSSTG
ncbi:methyltransferase domain-containing protein [Micromonospora sp. SL1-18]|uniref:methyltransferase domain-containing protein n=1 Tax=Micromonospora sp. SL1-18 TaxID=3399128 RepID=UPI003A4E28C0